ncbi:hypothetical protein A4H97_02565 [Niastella yeongjuensis]|uniref:FAS1 domain-containing protein n=1 Tax=Niastella yeongjuensis TaxID=354355 RepID=A0A1V9EX98_9BACT|nr:hypothetical protein A4H97_02565 [Niastella yeongjuensis]
MVLACSKKDKDDSPPANAAVKAIQDYLSQTDSVKTFGASFQSVKFADADVSGGLTVFAPVDYAITSYNPNGRIEAASLTADEVKDHVVKGIIKKSDLTNGKKLTTISGKELLVTVDGGNIMVNGALILKSKEDASFAVYNLDNVLCKKPGNAEITVFDATQWSTTDTLGKVAANADVALYTSRKDFINNPTQPAYTGKTDANGKITFTNLPAGTYYLVTKKDDKLNFFEPALINGELFAYKPIGIFQNQNQLSTLPRLGSQGVGDFIFLDANFDGIVNTNDKTWVPFEVVVASNKTVQVKSMVGYLKNQIALPFTSKTDAQQYLTSVYQSLLGWHQLQTVLDGMMSDDADCNTLPDFCAFDNFSFNPATSSQILLFYQNGYNYIAMLNRLINNVPALNLSSAETNELVGQAKGLRGFIYYELATYFGGLPLQTGGTDYNLSRAPVEATYAFIKNDIGDGISLLPARYVNADRNKINADACRLLMARVAMAQGDYTRAKQFTNDLIAGGNYNLMPAGSIFISDDNMEIIWNIGSGFMTGYIPFFNAGSSKTFCPVGRFTEVLLINTEARVNLGELDATYVNLLQARSGGQSVSFSDPAGARDAVQMVWKSEMPREGQRFAKLVKWGKAAAILGAKGYKDYNALLPIPTSALVRNPMLTQNPGF